MPLIALFNLGGAVGLPELLDAADAEYRLLVVTSGVESRAASDLAALEGIVDHLDASGMAPDALCDALAARGVEGVLTFSDEMIPTVAAVAERLGLPYHSPETAAAVTRKDVQRRVFAEAGVQTMRHTTFDDEAGMRRAAAEVGFPAVLKPVAGNGSTNVYPVDSVEELTAALRKAAAGTPSDAIRFGDFPGFGDCVWQLEERLRDGSHPSVPWLGDYVSVETLSLGTDGHWHFWVTDKLPLLPPFRESGAVGPTQLPDDLREEVCALVSAGLTALGVSSGVSHTEVKLTPEGPRIIEVNGRVGGQIPALIGQASDLDVVRMALHAAAGRADRVPVRITGTAALLDIHAPATATVVEQLADSEELKRIPGVWRVDVRAAPGTRVDYRAGLLGRVQNVWFTVGSLEELHRSLTAVHELVDATSRYTHAHAPEGTV
ncbi:acetyl-CoA carboxylase biotin carboxylase subunit family protein [Streptomyces sp. NPDC001594]|uniref:ATP-grasp domain-containing protein n=1 Tax=Streptomyces sp. NPDC001594 TaxID=3364590 RepID=UPI0036736BE7